MFVIIVATFQLACVCNDLRLLFVLARVGDAGNPLRRQAAPPVASGLQSVVPTNWLSVACFSMISPVILFSPVVRNT
jgi:hypothetical protein